MNGEKKLMTGHHNELTAFSLLSSVQSFWSNPDDPGDALGHSLPEGQKVAFYQFQFTTKIRCRSFWWLFNNHYDMLLTIIKQYLCIYTTAIIEACSVGCASRAHHWVGVRLHHIGLSDCIIDVSIHVERGQKIRLLWQTTKSFTCFRPISNCHVCLLITKPLISTL